MRTRYLTLLALALAPLAVQADDAPKLQHLYICRSPLLAFSFWEDLEDLRKKGITITPQILSEVCAHMKAGSDPQCLRVEAPKFDVIGTGYGGAMTMTDGKTKFWFHQPDAMGWVHPQYYVLYMQHLRQEEK